MPVAAQMSNTSNITFSDGGNFEEWAIYIQAAGTVGTAEYYGYYLNRGTTYVDGQSGSALDIQVQFVGIGSPADINAGDTFTITDASGPLIIYCPSLVGTGIIYYPDENGVLYSDSALTTAVTPDFDSVSESISGGEEESQESAIRYTDTMAISESTSLTASNSVSDSVGVSESISWSVVGGTTPSNWPTPTVHYTGSNPYDTANPIFDSRLAAETDPVVGKMLKTFIKDDNGEWIDFSDRFNQKGIDKLADYGQFKHSSEKKGGLPIIESTIGSLTLDNSDGFFDGRVVNLTTDLGSVASFETSSDEGTETSWRQREVKFESHMTLLDDSVIVRNLGVFLIKETDSNLFSKKASVSMTLESKMNLLKRTDASVVKDGMQWYRNKSISFLVRELLKTQFADTSNELPASYYINNIISLPVPSDVGDGVAYSIFSVPPEDSTGHNTEISYIRTMEIWNWNTGTLSSSSNNAYSVTSSTAWGSEGTSGALRPRAGDTLTIKDSSNGNDGEYQIRSISSSAIRLETPLNGTTESSMTYTISRLYFIHKDSELWEFQPLTNIYTLIFNFTDAVQTYNAGWERVPYYLYVSDNRVNVLLCLKPTYGYETYYREADSDPSYTRLWTYNGVSTSPASDQPLGGGARSSAALCSRSPNIYLYPGAAGTSTGEGFQVPFTYKHRSTAGAIPVPVDERNGTYVPTDLGPPSVYDNGSYLIKGWWQVTDQTVRGTSPVYTLDQHWIWLDRGPHEIWIEDWNTIVTLWAYDTGASYELLVTMLDTNTSTSYYLQDDYSGDNTWDAQGVCVTYTDNTHGTHGQRCYASVVWRPDLSTRVAGNFVCQIVSFNKSESPTTSIYTSSDKTILDICQFGSTSSPSNPGFVVSSILRDTGTEDDRWYEVATLQWTGSVWDYDVLMTSSSPVIKLKRGGSNEDYDVFMFHKYENRLLRYDHSAGVLVTMAAGNEVVEGEGSICSPLVIDKDTRTGNDIIYGISWSGEDPWALDALRLPNKGVLWKLDTFITPQIELADFDGLDVSEAIGKLAQACNHVALFNVLGDFFFVPRNTTDVDDYIIEHVGGQSLIMGSVKKDRGYGEIYNHFTITPSIVQLTEVEWEIILVKREEGEDDRDFAQFVEVNSLNNLKRKARLSCINGGMVSESPLFRFLVEYDNIDARIGQSVDSTDREILLSSTFGGDQLTEGVHTGDFLIVTHPDDGTQIIREVLGGRGQGRITSAASTTVSVNEASIYKVGDKIRLVSSTHRVSSTIISITGLTLTLNDAIEGTFSSGDDALLEVKGSPAYITIESTLGIDLPSGSEISVTRISASDDSSSKKAWSSDGVTYVTDTTLIIGYEFHVNNIDWITVGCWIQINLYSVANTWSKVTAIDSVTNKITVEDALGFDPSSHPSVSVYWAPDPSSFTEIPQSGFNVRISNGDGTVDPLFKAGDVFTISTEGLELRDDSKSRKIAVSLSSKNKHGKLDFPSIKNRFINPSLAEILSRNLLELYKSPHYKLVLTMYYLPLIDLIRINRLSTFKVISDKLFPNMQDFTRSFYMRSITIDLKKNMASLELIDKDAY